MSKERVQKFIIYRESIKHIKMSKLFVYGVDQNLSNSEIQVRLFLSFVCKYEIPCCESVKVLDTDPSKSSEYDSNFEFFLNFVANKFKFDVFLSGSETNIPDPV